MTVLVRTRTTAASRRSRSTRRALTLLVGAVLALALGNAPGASANSPSFPGHPRSFVTRPDLLPPAVTVGESAPGTAPGYVFLAPKTGDVTQGPGTLQSGPMIVDDEGEPVWFLPRGIGALNYVTAFQQQTYRGDPVLTWWEGAPLPTGVGVGYWVVMDQSYREIARIRAGSGYAGADLHDMQITPDNTALVLIAQPKLHRGGGFPRMVMDNIVQEVDLPSGKVIHEWSGLDHVGVDESYLSSIPLLPYDYLHINSMSLDTDGNLLLSGRNTHTVYKIDRRSGEVIWRLGGKKSDFTMADGASFAWQHDVSREEDGTLSVFDNAAAGSIETGGGEQSGTTSRAVFLSLDTATRTAKPDRAYTSPDGLLSTSQGSVQLLPNGNVLVGWGSHGYYTEYAASGKVLMNAFFKDPVVNSYRALRFPWQGRPADRPAVAGRSSGNGMTLHASWNGATAVESWRFLAGDTPQGLIAVEEVRRDGFETSATAARRSSYVAVQALDGTGRVIGTSATARVR
uniref:Aryl sulfotransferase n=1 Tax=Streptomyces sp. SANK 60405 TaxID=689687 RepID=D4QF15_9ACTN|nr:aryl sulfotransferase [Streptomyces sp. SANK 60405]